MIFHQLSRISSLTGAINQGAWDSASQGNILITFFAEYGTGKIGTSSVTVKKSIPSEPPEPDIPGYDGFLIVGLISLVAVILVKKIKTK